jgi:hypothetical protein
MKTTIDIPEDVYRRVKAKSALEGRPVRDVAITLFRAWVEEADTPVLIPEQLPAWSGDQPAPPWFGSLRSYAKNAQGQFDMDSIRRSIARGRVQEKRGR